MFELGAIFCFKTFITFEAYVLLMYIKILRMGGEQSHHPHKFLAI